MARVIREGIMDMIGAARPSIADPFLPSKIESGREDEIRECIGCNVCVAYANHMVPMRCTQNPTVGEEWRRGWHPERVASKACDDRVLIVGAGPTGLEAARVLSLRGHDVVLAEATQTLGGRVASEASLPGLAAWDRVRGYREHFLSQQGNVAVYRASTMEAEHVLAAQCGVVAIATGATWSSTGVGRSHHFPIPGHDKPHVLTPEQVMAHPPERGHILLFDDDQYYMGGVLAEWLRERGLSVTLVTPGAVASAWTEHSLEQARIQRQLISLGAEIEPLQFLTRIEDDEVELQHLYSDARNRCRADFVVLITTLEPNDLLYRALLSREAEWADHGVTSVTAVGDCFAPGTIAAAVWSGHKFGRELGHIADDVVPFKREHVELSEDEWHAR